MRIGSVNDFDSMNPFVGFSVQSYNVWTNVYPTLVQYDTKFKIVGDWAKSWETSKDGRTWTFHLKPGKWSDGKPLTAADAAWTGNLIIKYSAGPTGNHGLVPVAREQAHGPRPHDAGHPLQAGQRDGPDRPAAVLRAAATHLGALHGQRSQGAQGLRPGRRTCRSSRAGSYYVTKYDKKGTTLLERNPGFYGPRPHLDAVGITWFANSDALLAALKGGDIDYTDEVPYTVADQLRERRDIQLVEGQGSEIATSPSTRIRRSASTASCSIPSCARRSRTRSIAGRSSTSSSGATRSPPRRF